jgi:hypothetical protein
MCWLASYLIVIHAGCKSSGVKIPCGSKPNRLGVSSLEGDGGPLLVERREAGRCPGGQGVLRERVVDQLGATLDQPLHVRAHRSEDFHDSRAKDDVVRLAGGFVLGPFASAALLSCPQRAVFLLVEVADGAGVADGEVDAHVHPVGCERLDQLVQHQPISLG